MATFRKFTFDTSFDEPRVRPSERDAPPVSVDETVEPAPDFDEPPPPPPPTFSEEEVTFAREQAFQDGRLSGMQEAADTAEHLTAEALTTLTAGLGELFRAQEEANDQMARNAVRIAMAAVGKLLPAAAKRHAVEEIAGAVTECIQHVLDEPRIMVRVAESLVADVHGPVEAAAQAAGFEGRVLITPDPRVPPGDCRMEWADGGAERSQEKIWQAVEDTINRVLDLAPSSESAPPAAPLSL